jgi:hypothetical protein
MHSFGQVWQCCLISAIYHSTMQLQFWCKNIYTSRGTILQGNTLYVFLHPLIVNNEESSKCNNL